MFKEKMQEMYNSDNLDIFEPWREVGRRTTCLHVHRVESLSRVPLCA